MKTDEAITVCQDWLDHLDSQKQLAEKIQELAAMAKQGPKQQREARRQLGQIDQQPTVYDAAKLRLAVEHLLSILRHAEERCEWHCHIVNQGGDEWQTDCGDTFPESIPTDYYEYCPSCGRAIRKRDE